MPKLLVVSTMGLDDVMNAVELFGDSKNKRLHGLFLAKGQQLLPTLVPKHGEDPTQTYWQ